jgi:hypothetical protein
VTASAARILGAALLAAFLLGGCTSVAPWRRAVLAKPEMALEPDPGQRLLREHTYMSREGATGGYGGAGGGCGCY